MKRFALLWMIALALPASTPAEAQQRIPSHCIALAQGPDTVMTASFRDPVPADQVRVSYVDHAMFLIQTPGGLSAMTDFTGWFGNVDFTPDVVTMNNAHGTHWTPVVDPAIEYPLRGWAGPDGPAEHYLDLGEMLVRNVTTDVRSSGAVRVDGNSIFVFEVAGLCIGHLGHLHHEPTPRQYALLGRMDVVMVPVDGGLTLDHPTVIRVMDRLRARVVIPMHWFGRSTLDAFLTGMSDSFDIVRTGDTSLILSLADLPDRPTVMVLEPRILTD
ncbi:MBL fold metallo-hydrolase [Flavimaricola marinus]|uniref:Metal-dependent hydrolase n=1 Tax=Flavimaricola marinus TaxID=1819565 RepID=A0A238LA60_9RHOB|nr:MBL fold metallo-hydrolase [Flavimaricola marinus]SMY06569.1 hypothetical protein LOM8899_00696 [Flavimaricola marinus]